MLDWLFEVGNSPLWLTTDPNTRAARFYLSAGWTAEPQPHHGELRFTRRPAMTARVTESRVRKLPVAAVH